MESDDSVEAELFAFSLFDVKRYSNNFFLALKSRGICSWNSVRQIKHPRTKITGLNHYVEIVYTGKEFGEAYPYQAQYAIYRATLPYCIVPIWIDFNRKDVETNITVCSAEIIPNYAEIECDDAGNRVLRRTLYTRKFRHVLKALQDLQYIA